MMLYYALPLARKSIFKQTMHHAIDNCMETISCWQLRDHQSGWDLKSQINVCRMFDSHVKKGYMPMLWLSKDSYVFENRLSSSKVSRVFASGSRSSLQEPSKYLASFSKLINLFRSREDWLRYHEREDLGSVVEMTAHAQNWQQARYPGQWRISNKVIRGSFWSASRDLQDTNHSAELRT